MDQNQANEYIRRINTVCDYIEKNLGKDMTLKELACVAGFSEYHFHRIFSAMTGETLFSFIQRLRLERAAALLCMHNITVTEIAMSLCFSSTAVFSRVFKQRFGYSPPHTGAATGIKRKATWVNCCATTGKLVMDCPAIMETPIMGIHINGGLT